MGTTADITKASKSLEKLEAKLARVQSRKNTAIAKATTKATEAGQVKLSAATARISASVTKATNKAGEKYDEKVGVVENEIKDARVALQNLAASA